jgi:hypothetical protein
VAKHLEEIRRLATAASDTRCQANLQWLGDNFEFTLLLDEVGRQIEPAYRLKAQWLRGEGAAEKWQTELFAARQALAGAPIEKLFRTYARRVRSRGELGELSALNQKLWLQYRELEQFLARQK